MNGACEPKRAFPTRPRAWPFVIALLCAPAVLHGGAAHAQARPYRASKETRLTKQDLDALDAATKELLNRPALADGAFEVWSSPGSGASGSIVAGSAVQRNGLACRRLTYFTKVPGPGPNSDRTTDVVWCKTDAGWKMG